MWKTSYRLILAEKPALQGWAIVENQTDNDWTDVQLSLVSGRPISFIQDLYQPLYIPRPWVDGVVHLDYNRPPTGVPLIRWRQLINDCHKFLAAEDNWAERVAMFGWDAFALFGCHRGGSVTPTTTLIRAKVK